MKSIKIEKLDLNGNTFYTSQEVPTDISELEGGENLLSKELTYSIFYNGAEAETEFSYPFDFWKLNNDVTSFNGIGIGYISEQQDNVSLIQVLFNLILLGLFIFRAF